MGRINARRAGLRSRSGVFHYWSSASSGYTKTRYRRAAQNSQQITANSLANITIMRAQQLATAEWHIVERNEPEKADTGENGRRFTILADATTKDCGAAKLHD
jgi:hypothetical protein